MNFAICAKSFRIFPEVFMSLTYKNNKFEEECHIAQLYFSNIALAEMWRKHQSRT
jgi:hypothetical protein